MRQIDTFTGDDLGDCNGFDLGGSGSVEIEMEHRGIDGGHLMWARINGTDGAKAAVSLSCAIDEKLDGRVTKTYGCLAGGKCNTMLFWWSGPFHEKFLLPLLSVHIAAQLLSPKCGLLAFWWEWSGNYSRG